MKEQVLIDQMNLYDYVMTTFERYCDLTEGRRISLNYVLNNCMAKYVNVAEFKAVFGITTGLDGILRVITDFEKFEELNQYGMNCYQEVMKEQALVGEGPVLGKIPQ